MKQHEEPVYSELEDGLLLAYVDGAVDADTRRRIEERLARDPKLQAEVANLVAIQADLAQASRAASGPGSQELGEYVLGLLPPDRMAAIEKQLAADPVRRAEAERLQRYLVDVSLPQPAGARERPAGRVAVLVAQLVSGFADLAAGGLPALAPAGVRGGDAVPAVYQVGEGQLILEIAADAQRRERGERSEYRSLQGLLVGIPAPGTLTANLYGDEASGDLLVASVPCDELGNFVLEGIVPGDYELVLNGPELDVLVPHVQVK